LIVTSTSCFGKAKKGFSDLLIDWVVAMIAGSTKIPNNSYIYYGVVDSPTELVLKPRCSRRQAMGEAWQGCLFLGLWVFPFLAVVPAALVLLMVMIASIFVHPVSGSWPTLLMIGLWLIALGGLAVVMGKAMETSGYTIYVFDRTHKQLIIKTENLLGKTYIQKIPFAKIYDVQFTESRYKTSPFMRVALLFGEYDFSGITHPKTIVLSSFSLTRYDEAKLQEAEKHHRSLLLLVKNTLKILA
jgi:hypothetical protein